MEREIEPEQPLTCTLNSSKLGIAQSEIGRPGRTRSTCFSPSLPSSFPPLYLSPPSVRFPLSRSPHAQTKTNFSPFNFELPSRIPDPHSIVAAKALDGIRQVESENWAGFVVQLHFQSRHHQNNNFDTAAGLNGVSADGSILRRIIVPRAILNKHAVRSLLGDQ